MSKESNKELEALIKNLFIQSRRPASQPRKVRIQRILLKSLHELALRDLVILFARLVKVMFSILSMSLKLIASRP